MKDLLVSKDMTTTSIVVADHFGKIHRDVVRAIENLKCSEEFSMRNFAHSEFINTRGKKYDGYIITRDGFSMLAMGFNGAKAAQWKEKFLAAFNAMEKALLKTAHDVEWKAARLQLKNQRKETTDAVKDFVDYAISQGSTSAKMYYSNITTMEYRALGLLEQSKQVEGNFRDTLDLMQIGQLHLAEAIATKAIQFGMDEKLHYKEVYIFAKKKVEEYANSISWMKLDKKDDN